MKRSHIFILLGVLLMSSILGYTYTHHQAVASGPISFNEKIQPILAENCTHCHGPDSGSRKAGLRLDREKDALAERPGHRPAIVRGNPALSEIIRRIESVKPNEIMPPPASRKTLKPEEIELLKQWIAQGAHYEPHWSFVAPVRPDVPSRVELKEASLQENWSRNPIDAFVLTRLQKAGMDPEPEADPRTLIRRVTLDLTGLPPTPEEVEAFVKNPSREHYEKWVDQLLSRPQYGENEGRIWLDAARYSDTVGLHIDNYRSIWPYRDWVINAFNQNMPYDRFVTEQLAGDLLPNATDDQKIATGFIRSQETTDEGGSILEEVAATMAAEQVDAVSTVFTGLTMKCCACHDHKFDALSQKDFYSLSAFFRNTTQPIMDGRRMDTPPTIFIPANDADKARWLAIEPERTALEKQISDLRNELKKKNEDKAQPLSDQEKTTLENSMKVAQGKRDALKKEITDIYKRGKLSLIVQEKKNYPPTAYILKRGDYTMKGEKVVANTPEALPPMDPSDPKNRLGLAHWLMSPQHPLTARVMVNRLWQQFFGMGIVKSSEDFGIMGDRPTNQPLLDWLAVEFRESGWDMKHMIRLMVTSSAYKQSPVISPEKLEKDPENRLVSRGPRFRMEGEVIRDQALAASGLLNPTIGGPSVKGYQPPGLWEAVTMPDSDTARYVADTGDKLYRRSMYIFWKRQSPPPELDTLGAPTRETCTVRRVRTNTPLQALEVLNDPQFVEAARKLGLDAIRAASDPRERLNYFSERLMARPLKESEAEDLLATEQKIEAAYTRQPRNAESFLNTGQLPPASDIPAVTQATWGTVASIFLNLDETLNR